MSDSSSILHDLDLLDDWLAGKGYGEEAGLVLRALSLIHKLQDGVRSTIQERDVLSGENFDLRAENEKLRAALKRDYGGVWDELAQQQREIEKLRAKLHAATGELCDRAAAAALKETGYE